MNTEQLIGETVECVESPQNVFSGKEVPKGTEEEVVTTAEDSHEAESPAAFHDETTNESEASEDNNSIFERDSSDNESSFGTTEAESPAGGKATTQEAAATQEEAIDEEVGIQYEAVAQDAAWAQVAMAQSPNYGADPTDDMIWTEEGWEYRSVSTWEAIEDGSSHATSPAAISPVSTGITAENVAGAQSINTRSIENDETVSTTAEISPIDVELRSIEVRKDVYIPPSWSITPILAGIAASAVIISYCCPALTALVIANGTIWAKNKLRH